MTIQNPTEPTLAMDAPTYAPWPTYDQDEIDAVASVLRSGRVNYWTGDLCHQFEREFAGYVGRRHGVAVANGTLALELALHAFQIGPGDEVVVPSRTYIASASCAVMTGAVPVVVDIDRDSQALTADTIRPAITERTRAIVVVHLAGWPADMPEIMRLASEKDLIVIEDCAQAHGARLGSRPVGAFGHAAAFSFCQDKIMSTGGEGGMLVVDDEHIWKRAWGHKDIGRSWDAVYRREHPPGFRWLTESFGTNWRLTEIQAAIGLVQLGKLDGWVKRRRAHAATLRRCLASTPALRIPDPSENIYHSYYRFYAFVESRLLKAGWTRDLVLEKLTEAGVPCSVGSCSEIYREKAFADRGWGPAMRLPVAVELGDSSISLLVHPTLSDAAVRNAGLTLDGIMRDAAHGSP